MKVITITILSLLLLMGVVVSPGLAAQTSTTDQVASQLVSGIIEKVDPERQSVTIKSDQEKGAVRSLEVIDAKAMKDLAKGDGVIVELDEQGKAVKFVKTDLEDPAGGEIAG
jgi:Cu/Ag efflux protein CusF